MLKVIELNSSDFRNWYYLGRSYLEIDEHIEAIKSFLKSIELNSEYSLNYNWLGCSYYESGQYKNAIKSLKRALELNKEDDSNWYWLILSYHKNKQYEYAIKCYFEAIEFNPNNEYKETLEKLLKEIGFDINNANSWVVLGHLYNKDKRSADAIKCFIKAIELNKNE